MQMIKGTDIEIATESGFEKVRNVLVGEPGRKEMLGHIIQTYVLGLPKGDTHDWADKKLRIFGRAYRTVGLPLEGIEENIPTPWHKQVSAEMLLPCAPLTLYEKDTFARHVFADVFFADLRGQKTQKGGEHTAQNVTAYIYGCCHDGSYMPKAGDIIVSGECGIVFDMSSQESTSRSMAALREERPKYAVVKSISEKSGVYVPDIEITAV